MTISEMFREGIPDPRGCNLEAAVSSGLQSSLWHFEETQAARGSLPAHMESASLQGMLVPCHEDI